MQSSLALPDSRREESLVNAHIRLVPTPTPTGVGSLSSVSEASFTRHVAIIAAQYKRCGREGTYRNYREAM